VLETNSPHCGTRQVHGWRRDWVAALSRANYTYGTCRRGYRIAGSGKDDRVRLPENRRTRLRPSSSTKRALYRSGHNLVTTEARFVKGKCRRFNALSVLRSSLGSFYSAIELRPPSLKRNENSIEPDRGQQRQPSVKRSCQTPNEHGVTAETPDNIEVASRNQVHCQRTKWTKSRVQWRKRLHCGASTMVSRPAAAS
jgi:hypothetical protein